MKKNLKNMMYYRFKKLSDIFKDYRTKLSESCKIFLTANVCMFVTNLSKQLEFSPK